MTVAAMEVPVKARTPLTAQARPVLDDALVARHAGLVKRIALHVSARLPDRVLLDDLVQAGLLGLVEAAGKFDPEQGVPFESFASNRIRGAMWDEARRMDWTPRSVHRKSREASQAMLAVQNREGRGATDAEVAAELGIDAEAYAAVLRDAQTCRLLSIDAERPEHDTPMIVSEDADADLQLHFESAAMKARVAKAIGDLPSREQLLLALYYNEELNLREIGEVLSVTESRVCQLHGRALLRLRSLLEAQETGFRANAVAG